MSAGVQDPITGQETLTVDDNLWITTRVGATNSCSVQHNVLDLKIVH